MEMSSNKKLLFFLNKKIYLKCKNVFYNVIKIYKLKLFTRLLSLFWYNLAQINLF